MFVTCKDDEVMVFCDFEGLDLGSGDDYVGVASSLLYLRLYVSECAADR